MENEVVVNGSGFKEGQTFQILGRKVKGKDILANRIMEYSKDSKKPGLVNGYLVHPKTGKLQKTEIAIPVELLEMVPGREVEVTEEVAV